MKTRIILLTLLLGYQKIKGQEIAIRNVNVFDTKTGKQHSNYSVLTSNGKISWVGPDKNINIRNSETVTIDGTGKYLIPGLIDTHIHFFQSGSLYTRPDGLNLTNKVPYDKERKQGFENTADYLKRYLRLGITTVIDEGGPFNNFAIRDSISKLAISPNVYVTGPLFSIVERKELELSDPPIVKIESNGDVDILFNKMLGRKPDFIKVWYVADKNHPAEKSFPIVKHIGELSAKNNLKLAVHATELKTAQLAVDAGANILVHSIDDKIIPDDFVKILKNKNVTYVPTLIVANNYYKTFASKLTNHPQDLLWANAHAYGTLTDFESMDSSALPPIVKWLRKNGIPKTAADSIMKINLMKLVKNGINVATGTDAGNTGTFHASSYIQELEAMRTAGLSNEEILKSSTINAAIGFGIDDKVGSIETGKYADLLLLNKNPVESIQNLNSIEFIFRKTGMIKADTLLKENPEAVVQRQLNAYNARNLDIFLETYADSVEILRNGKILVKGREQMRKAYDFFSRVPNLYCQIENRMVFKAFVIDKEKVRIGKNTVYGVAIYEVENGKIKRVTFLE